MGLATFLIGKAIENTTSNIGKVAAAAAVTATAATVVGAVEKKRELNAVRSAPMGDYDAEMIEARAELERARLEIENTRRELLEQSSNIKNDMYSKKKGRRISNNPTPYEVSLLYAKLAMCSYIIHSDRKVSQTEESVIDNMLEIAEEEFGDDVCEKAQTVYEACSYNFMVVQDYLNKVDVKDIRLYLQSAEDIAELDGCGDAEIRAINKLNAYINQRIKDETSTTFQNKYDSNPYKNGIESFTPMQLTCPGCAAKMKMDEYGYMAECEYCGLEKIINPDKAPLRFINTPVKKSNVQTTAKKKEPNIPTNVIPTIPKMPEKPVYPRKSTPQAISDYQMKMTIYQQEMEQYKKDFVAYQKYVMSHPNV